MWGETADISALQIKRQWQVSTLALSLSGDVELFTTGNNRANKEGNWHTENREQHQLSLSVEVFWLGDIDARLPTSVESRMRRPSGGGSVDSSQRPSSAQIFVSIEFPKAI